MTIQIKASKQTQKHPTIHPTAIVAPTASIGEGTIIHPYAVIGEHTRIGKECIVYPFAHIGSAPQVRSHDEGHGQLVIGDGNRFFEGCTISLGHSRASGLTRIGDHNLFMAYTHVGHDCTIGSHSTIANHSSLAGHVRIEDHANIGGYAGIHQFVQIGCHSFIGANSMVSQDVPPFSIAAGDRARLLGLNRKGLARAQFLPETEQEIRRAFRQCFYSLTEHSPASVSPSSWHTQFTAFVERSQRGVLKRHSTVDTDHS